jgi:hypothetical protein
VLRQARSLGSNSGRSMFRRECCGTCRSARRQAAQVLRLQCAVINSALRRPINRFEWPTSPAILSRRAEVLMTVIARRRMRRARACSQGSLQRAHCLQNMRSVRMTRSPCIVARSSWDVALEMIVQ